MRMHGLGHDRRPRRRRGISLMEVIFALGIIVAGLVGVAVLIPVAGKLANDGTTADRAAREALNAIREMELRGMSRPINWVQLADGLDNNSNGNVDEPAEISTGSTSVPALTGFCLDPRFVAANQATILSGTTAPADARYFPYVNLGAEPFPVPLRRITVWDQSKPLAVPPAFMSQLMADDLFVAQDDLVTSIPGVDDNQPTTNPPQQVYNFSPAPSSLVEKRQTEGRISWMATIVPSHDGDYQQDVYTLSIVIFLNRDAAMLMDGNSERVAWIEHEQTGATGFSGGGVTGGDVVLRTRAGRPASDLDVKRGQWVMLARRSGTDPQIAPTIFTGPIMRWYKLMEVDPGVDTAGSQSSRSVTLYGPDWVPDVNYRTYVYIVPDIIAVYEKQIRLENTSLWTP